MPLHCYMPLHCHNYPCNPTHTTHTPTQPCFALPPAPLAEPSLKLLEEGDFMKAWGGIAGLQYALPSTWQPWQEAGLNLTRFVQVGLGGWPGKQGPCAAWITGRGVRPGLQEAGCARGRCKQHLPNPS